MPVPAPDEETPLVGEEKDEKKGGGLRCCGICCCIIILLLLLFIFVGIPLLCQYLANQSTMSLETGSISNIQGLGSLSQGVTADIHMAWDLDIPHIATIHDTMDGNNKLGPDWDKMRGSTKMNNPTWDKIWLKSMTVSVKGPVSEGRKLFAEVKTPDAHIPPGETRIDFPTWLRVPDTHEADHVVKDVLASPAGGDIIVELHPTFTLFSFLTVQVDILKALQCKATGDKLNGFPAYNSFSLKCDYLGNA